MTLMHGKPARDLCHGGGRLEPGDVLAVGRQLAGALAVVHAHGTLHHDVLIDLGQETTAAALVDCGMVEFE